MLVAASLRFPAFINSQASGSTMVEIQAAVLTRVEAIDEDRVVFLTINGMSCTSCATKVQDALSAVEGVTSVTVDLKTKQAVIFLMGDSDVLTKDLAEVVQSVGQTYSATVATRTILLAVEGMSCAKSCTRKVQQALCATEGVMAASVDFEAKKASVDVARDHQYDEELLLEAVRTADCRFKARLIGPDAKTAPLIDARDDGSKQMIREHDVLDSSEVALSVGVSGSDALMKVTLLIAGMTCNSCAHTVEGALKRIVGVVSVSVNFATEKAVVQFDKDITCSQVLVNAVEDIGYNASCMSEEKSQRGDIVLLIGGMMCGSCSNSIETLLINTEGVLSASVNLATGKAAIRYDKTMIGIRTLIESVEAIGYEASYVSGAEGQNSLGDQRGKELKHYRSDLCVALAFTLPILLIMLVLENISRLKQDLMSEVLPGLSWEALVVAIFTTPVQFYSARRFHVNAWKGMKNGILGMAVLVSLGSGVSYFYGLFTIVRAIMTKRMEVTNLDMFMTSSVLISFVLLGKMLEVTAKGKTSAALTKLMELQVKSATLLVFSLNGLSIREERVVPIELVQRGDILKVVRGSSIPIDGVIVYGEARVDESMLTGESKTIKKAIGDRVLGATVNVEGLCHMKVTSIDNNTALSQIIRLVEDAQSSKAPIQAYADYISSIFVPVVVCLSLATIAVWYILCIRDIIPEDWIPKSDGKFVFALDFGIATLVVACPCALGLATPTAVMVGTGVGAAHGILIKGGEPLQAAHSVNTVIFDKTGTLTKGKPAVTDAFTLSKTMSAKELAVLAGSAELGSEHPLGAAITAYAKSLSVSLEQPTDFIGISGRGISCVVCGHKIAIGNKMWMVENDTRGLDNTKLGQAINDSQNAGKTLIYMDIDGELGAMFAVADAPRVEAAPTLETLKTMGLEIWMVTGDNTQTALTIADQLGISRHNVMADVLPSQKSSKVKELQDTGHTVVMIGDGINDSPALAQADLGIAIGAGTEIAIETAGMVLMKSNLFDVITALDLSQTIFNRIRLNFLWAFGYNSLLIPVAAGVLYPVGFTIPPMFASAAMALSSVSVVISSLLLRFYTPPIINAEKLKHEVKSTMPTDQTLSIPLLAYNTLQETESSWCRVDSYE
ncbi:unnamed protein product [Phytophthora fragariaefolia]|uniref:P-type Cu(+) transporter n=1 Tax=Phytophthora fragariaefolia TaxID=1490495 RepID=A0A9W6X080_9STRA|nr:unnamed protein product [Phytophthora fragariaefolia]